MKVAKSLSGGEGVHRGWMWSFESCSNSHAEPRAVHLGTAGGRLQEDGQDEPTTGSTTTIAASFVVLLLTDDTDELGLKSI